MIYLYVKECPHCGLKYFGKTAVCNPFKYHGSGVYWKRHYRIHKVMPNTLEVWGFDNKEDCQTFALMFSAQNDIVESMDWANLRNENGLDGAPAGHVNSHSARLKMRSNHYLKNGGQHSRGMAGKQHSPETRAQMSATKKGKPSHRKGKNLSLAHVQNMKKTMQTTEFREKMSRIKRGQNA